MDFTLHSRSLLLLFFLETTIVDTLMSGLQGAEDSLAAFELLTEKLVEFVKHFEQIGGGGFANHDL